MAIGSSQVVRSWLGYTESAGGLFTSGNSVASVNALVIAREAAGYPKRATIYMSDETHSFIGRAAMVVGIRPECIRTIPSDQFFRLDMKALRDAVTNNRAQGLNLIAICANAGTTNTGAIDPLKEIADYCEAEGLWFHVDAAYGGFAVLTEKGKETFKWN